MNTQKTTKKNMKIFKFTFIGRLNTSIGICYKITAKTTAENLEAAKLALYTNYEHITNLKHIK